MHPSKVTLRPKVRRPMAWDSTKSAPSAQQPEPSTQCPIPGGYRRAETRHHRIDHPARLREDAQQPDMIAAIPLRHSALRATTGCLRRDPPSLLRTARRNSTPSNTSPGSAAHCAQKPDPIAGDTPRDSSNGYGNCARSQTQASSTSRLDHPATLAPVLLPTFRAPKACDATAKPSSAFEWEDRQHKRPPAAVAPSLGPIPVT